MEIIGAIFTGMRTLAGAIFPPLKKKYFDQPKVYLTFKRQSSAKKPSLSAKNDTTQPIDLMEAIWFCELRWRYKLTLLNNSEHHAYNIRLLEPLQEHHFLLDPKIDRLKPLLSNTETDYEAIFNDIFEGKGREANEIIQRHPFFLTNNRYVLEYTNVKGKKFYTIFDASKSEELRNEFVRKYYPEKKD